MIYHLLFQSIWHTIQTFGHDPKRLNGRMGMTAVLYTWGQNLSQHVHLHYLIPAGALSQDQQHWHVLPEELMRIRHYGFLSNRSRKQQRETILACLQISEQAIEDDEVQMAHVSRLSDTPCPCPKCHIGHLRLCYEIPAKRESKR